MPVVVLLFRAQVVRPVTPIQRNDPSLIGASGQSGTNLSRSEELRGLDHDAASAVPARQRKFGEDGEFIFGDAAEVHSGLQEKLKDLLPNWLKAVG